MSKGSKVDFGEHLFISMRHTTSESKLGVFYGFQNE